MVKCTLQIRLRVYIDAQLQPRLREGELCDIANACSRPLGEYQKRYLLLM